MTDPHGTLDFKVCILNNLCSSEIRIRNYECLFCIRPPGCAVETVGFLDHKAVELENDTVSEYVRL
jgi:hypothetical protein